MSIRHVFFGISAAICIVWGAKDAYAGAYFSALSLLLSAAALIMFALLEGAWFEEGSPPKLVLVCAACAGLAGVFFDPSNFSVERQAAHAELAHAFGQLIASPQIIKRREDEELVQRGLMVCALRGPADLSEMALAAEKNIRLGPVSTTVDRTYSELDGSSGDDPCLSIFEALYARSPEIFVLTDVRKAIALTKTISH